MNNLYNPEDVTGIISRIEKLTPDTQRQWGKMSVDQMLAHCNIAMDTALGKNVIPRTFSGKILGPIAKRHVLSEKPFGKNSPTDKSYKLTGHYDFQIEK